MEISSSNSNELVNFIRNSFKNWEKTLKFPFEKNLQITNLKFKKIFTKTWKNIALILSILTYLIASSKERKKEGEKIHLGKDKEKKNSKDVPSIRFPPRKTEADAINYDVGWRKTARSLPFDRPLKGLLNRFPWDQGLQSDQLFTRSPNDSVRWKI